MSESSGAYDIMIFLLILNIASPYFVYAFTDINPNQEGYTNQVNTLSIDSLYEAGIPLVTDEGPYLLMWEGGHIEYVNLSTPMRILWSDPVGGVFAPDNAFSFYTRRWPDTNPSWIFRDYRPVYIDGVLYNPDTPTIGGGAYIYPTNQTIINAWDVKYNWTRISQRDLGIEIFVTCEKYDNNIVDAIEAGELNVTSGDLFDDDDSLDPRKFINYYSGMITGQNDYNLPPAVSWIFRIQLILFLFSVVVVGRDLLPIV